MLKRIIILDIFNGAVVQIATGLKKKEQSLITWQTEALELTGKADPNGQTAHYYTSFWCQKLQPNCSPSTTFKANPCGLLLAVLGYVFTILHH